MREMGNTRKLDENKGTFKPNQIHILCNSQMYIGNEIAESLAKIVSKKATQLPPIT